MLLLNAIFFTAFLSLLAVTSQASGTSSLAWSVNYGQVDLKVPTPAEPLAISAHTLGPKLQYSPHSQNRFFIQGSFVQAQVLNEQIQGFDKLRVGADSVLLQRPYFNLGLRNTLAIPLQHLTASGPLTTALLNAQGNNGYSLSVAPNLSVFANPHFVTQFSAEYIFYESDWRPLINEDTDQNLLLVKRQRSLEHSVAVTQTFKVSQPFLFSLGYIYSWTGPSKYYDSDILSTEEVRQLEQADKSQMNIGTINLTWKTQSLGRPVAFNLGAAKTISVNNAPDLKNIFVNLQL